MGILSDAEFLQHQQFLGDAFADVRAARDLVQSGLALVVASTDIQVEIDLLEPYRINLDSMEDDASSQLLGLAARALNAHIVEVSGQTLNDYLFTNGLKVTQEYADLSGLLGAPIDPTNIE